MKKIRLIQGPDHAELARSARGYATKLTVAMVDELDTDAIGKPFTIKVVVEHQGIVSDEKAGGIATVYCDIERESREKHPELAEAGLHEKFMIAGYHLDRTLATDEVCFLVPPTT